METVKLFFNYQLFLALKYHRNLFFFARIPRVTGIVDMMLAINLFPIMYLFTKNYYHSVMTSFIFFLSIATVWFFIDIKEEDIINKIRTCKNRNLLKKIRRAVDIYFGLTIWSLLFILLVSYNIITVMED